MNHLRQRLDQLFVIDAIVSVIFGLLALVAPHGVLMELSGTVGYNHNVHEVLRYVAAHYLFSPFPPFFRKLLYLS